MLLRPLLLTCFCLLLFRQAESQDNFFLKKVALQYSYYKIDDCKCEFEPKGGFKYYPSFGPSASIQLPITKRILLHSTIGYFKHTYQSNAINTQYFHDFGSIYYYEAVHYTRNVSFDFYFGLLIGNNRFNVIPEVGMVAYSRKNLKSDWTQTNFYNVENISYRQFPIDEPDAVYKSSGEDVQKWSSLSFSIGLTSYIKIVSRWSLKLSAHYMVSPNWIKDYVYKQKFFQMGTGVSFDL